MERPVINKQTYRNNHAHGLSRGVCKGKEGRPHSKAGRAPAISISMV